MHLHMMHTLMCICIEGWPWSLSVEEVHCNMVCWRQCSALKADPGQAWIGSLSHCYTALLSLQQQQWTSSSSAVVDWDVCDTVCVAVTLGSSFLTSLNPDHTPLQPPSEEGSNWGNLVWIQFYFSLLFTLSRGFPACEIGDVLEGFF